MVLAPTPPGPMQGHHHHLQIARGCGCGRGDKYTWCDLLLLNYYCYAWSIPYSVPQARTRPPRQWNVHSDRPYRTFMVHSMLPRDWLLCVARFHGDARICFYRCFGASFFHTLSCVHADLFTPNPLALGCKRL